LDTGSSTWLITNRPWCTGKQLPLGLSVFGQRKEIMKRGWWSLKIHDYPSFKPNDADLEHIAEAIKQGYDQGELIQEEDKERT